MKVIKVLKKILNHILKKLQERGLYKYKSYKEYKRTQIEGNKAKIDKCWVSEDNIKLLSKYLKQNVPNLKFGICHGTRRGKEQEWFRKYLGIEVIGTEISPTATQFPNTIEWDFRELKDEWINNVDFIYSNSFDHSYKPEECLDAWMSCVKKDGVCILEWTTGHIASNALEPFGGNKKDYEELITRKYCIKDKIKGSGTGWRKRKKSLFFIISHKECKNNDK